MYAFLGDIDWQKEATCLQFQSVKTVINKVLLGQWSLFEKALNVSFCIFFL